MEYRKYVLILVLVMSVFLGGCSNNEQPDETQSIVTETTENGSNDDNSEENTEQETDSETSDNNQENTNITESEALTETTYFEVDKSNPFSQNGYSLEVKGIKEYSSIESELYTDTPAENSKYLVLFLKVTNKTYENDYINYENIEAKTEDGERLESTFLVNDPEGYPTIKDNIDSGESKYGYLVWEVKEDWKSLEISYTGWEHAIHAVPVITVTPEDLFDPISYDEIDSK